MAKYLVSEEQRSGVSARMGDPRNHDPKVDPGEKG